MSLVTILNTIGMQYYKYVIPVYTWTKLLVVNEEKKKEQDPTYKWLKWVSFLGFPDSHLNKFSHQVGAQSKNYCTSVLIGAGLGGSGMRRGCLLDNPGHTLTFLAGLGTHWDFSKGDGCAHSHTGTHAHTHTDNAKQQKGCMFNTYVLCANM